MYLGQWDASLDPVGNNSQFSRGGRSSHTGMAAVVIALALKHTFHFKEQSIPTSRAVYANRLLRIGIVNGNNDNTTRVCGGGEGICHNLIFFIYL